MHHTARLKIPTHQSRRSTHRLAVVGGPLSRARKGIAGVAVLLATVHAGPARGQANPEDVPLADFEDPASAALFAQDSRPLAKVTNERASGGASCLRMDFGRYIKGGPQWPGVFVSTADLPAPVDWSAYAALLLDVYTPTPAGGTLRIILKTGDGTNEEWYTAAEIPAGEWQLRGAAEV